MATCLGKSCSFNKLTVRVLRGHLLFVSSFASFPFGFEDGR